MRFSGFQDWKLWCCVHHALSGFDVISTPPWKRFPRARIIKPFNCAEESCPAIQLNDEDSEEEL
eukprot:44291-Eustigmatos_ZCMA.PRE.1